MRYYFLALGTLVFVCVGCVMDGNQVFPKDEYHAPPAEMMHRPGPMVDGPGPGVQPMLAPPPPRTFATRATQVKFINPPGMAIGWMIPGGYAENQLVAPGRYDFAQGATYRLKLTDIPGREGLVVYPSLQVYPSHPTTDAYLAHNNVPIELTEEDLDQVETNNFVTKVIYLPHPRFQELAIAGVETLVSTRLDPGVDPVAEADRRGTIMAVLRVGNMDLEMPGRAPVGPPPPFGRPPFGPPPAEPDDEEESASTGVDQVSYRQLDGEAGQHAPPMPIALQGDGMPGIPHPTIIGGASLPGMPAPHPVAGMGGLPSWGQPVTGTPIGLPGPPHLPFGGPAGLKSHTVRNHTHVDIGKPVDHFVMDVKHTPGYRLPHPVRHVEYKESHPVYKPGEASYPAWQLPGGAVPPAAAVPQHGPMPHPAPMPPHHGPVPQ